VNISVVSWNILKGERYDEILQGLKELNADVFGLQEVAVWKDNRGNVGEKLAQELGYHLYFCPALPSQQSGRPYDLGNAILSRFECKNQVCHQLSPADLYGDDWTTEPRNAVEVGMNSNETDVRVINTHVYYPRYGGKSEISEMHFRNLDALLSYEKTILVGDFNATMSTEPIKKINKILPNVDRENEDFTFIDREQQKMKIDHIFVSKDIIVKSFEVVETKGSDHLPIKVVIKV